MSKRYRRAMSQLSFHEDFPQKTMERILLEAQNPSVTPVKNTRRLSWKYALAACLVVTMAGTCLSVFAYTDAQEYRKALDYCASKQVDTQGLTKEEIKDMYREYNSCQATETPGAMHTSIPNGTMPTENTHRYQNYNACSDELRKELTTCKTYLAPKDFLQHEDFVNYMQAQYNLFNENMMAGRVDAVVVEFAERDYILLAKNYSSKNATYLSYSTVSFFGELTGELMQNWFRESIYNGNNEPTLDCYSTLTPPYDLIYFYYRMNGQLYYLGTPSEMSPYTHLFFAKEQTDKVVSLSKTITKEIFDQSGFTVKKACSAEWSLQLERSMYGF